LIPGGGWKFFSLLSSDRLWDLPSLLYHWNRGLFTRG